MAVTTTQKLGLPQWGAGSDSPSRTAINGAFAAIDAKVALDLGEVGAAALPTADVVAGRYAPTVDGVYRRLHRRTATGWQQVGGNTWGETTYARADGAVAAAAPARIVSHPSLASAGLTEAWDGSSVRGGRQAVGDLNAGAPGAFHAGDTTAAVDLAQRGRFYALTAGNGGRGFVATAHAAAAGPLYAARDAGGSEPWLVDSLGRMRAQAPTAFGAAALTAGVPLVSSPGANDATAMDLYATGTKPALRLFRAPGDSIGEVLPNSIRLGKAGWTGGVLSLLAPSIALTGALALTGGQTISGALDVDGTTTLAALAAETTDLGSTTMSSLRSNGSSTLVGDVTLSGRLDLPTNRPSGTSAGQVRVADDWSLETYDGTTWRGHHGNRSGRVHLWGQDGGILNSGSTHTKVTGWSTEVAGSIATRSGGDIKLNRAGLWTIVASFYVDVGTDGYAGAKLSATDRMFTGRSELSDVRQRKITNNLPGSGIAEVVLSWTGYVSAEMAQQTLSLGVFQFNHTGTGTTSTSYRLAVEYLGA